jgi:hypothetical protein
MVEQPYCWPAGRAQIAPTGRRAGLVDAMICANVSFAI